MHDFFQHFSQQINRYDKDKNKEVDFKSRSRNYWSYAIIN